MRRRLLDFLCCPLCRNELRLEAVRTTGDEEVVDGLLACGCGARFPVVEGIPRMLVPQHDRRIRASFSREWRLHRLGDRTWGMALADRVQWYFLGALKVTPDSLKGKVLLDAGCGNGSQSVAYTGFGMEVVALDISHGVDLGRAFSRTYSGGQPDLIHFVQADLMHPPLRVQSFDYIHSAGVLHATPSTEKAFRAISPLLKPGGKMAIWVYSKEPCVTSIVDLLRVVTVKIPPAVFFWLCVGLAPLFSALTRLLDLLRVRTYPRLTWRESALALIDIFGSPYAWHHSFDEVREWFESEGLVAIYEWGRSRRGFGVAGELRQ